MRAFMVFLGFLTSTSVCWGTDILLSYDDGSDSPPLQILTVVSYPWAGTYFELDDFTDSTSVTINSLELWVRDPGTYRVAVFATEVSWYPSTIVWEDTLTKEFQLMPLTASCCVEVEGDCWVGVDRLDGDLFVWNCMVGYSPPPHSYAWDSFYSPFRLPAQEWYFRAYASEGSMALSPTTWGFIKAALGN